MQTLTAEIAVTVGVDKGHDDEIADFDHAYIAADGLDNASRFVSDGPPRFVMFSTIRPKIAAADARPGDAHERVGRVDEGGIRNALNPNVFRHRT